MDLAKELINDVLRERSFFLTKTNTADCLLNEKMKSLMTSEADQFIQNELCVSVHVFMNHTGCKISNQEAGICSAVQKLEEWTFKLHRERPLNAAAVTPILPLFLKQALRSQLHFSPLRSWLSAKLQPNDLFPIVRVKNEPSNVSWSIPDCQIQTHKFPVCCITGLQKNLTWLEVELRWLKREHFLEKIPHCSGIELCCRDGLILDELDLDRQDEEPSSSGSDSESTTLVDSTAPNSLSSAKWGPWNEDGKSRRIGEEHQRSQFICREHNQMGIEEKSKVEHGSIDKRMETVNSEQQNTPIARCANPNAPSPTTYRQPQRNCRRLADSSSPMPSPSLHRRLLQRNNKRVQNQQIGRAIEVTETRQEDEGKLRQGKEFTAFTGDSTFVHMSKFEYHHRHYVPHRLICNFEESILNGRLLPSNTVDGYRLQLTVIPAIPTRSVHFSSRRLTFPVKTHFFDEMVDNAALSKTPTSLHLAVCELGSEGVPVPSQCNLQAVLFNPQGSVIKIFMIGVDVQDMPPSSNTFIRQRTYSETGTAIASVDAVSNGNTGMKRTTNNGPGSVARSSSALRFLIHLRLSSDALGHVRLHTDIRMLFSNKSNDLEGLENILRLGGCKAGGGMRSVVEMPNMPKYSPIR